MPFEQEHRAPYPALVPANFASDTVNKAVVVTGGGGGIGAAIAEAFALAGATHVHLLGRTQEALESTATRLDSKHPNTTFTSHKVDVTSASDVSSFFGTISNADILVNNAGYLNTPCNFIDADLSDYWRSFEVNIRGTINMTQAFLRHRRSRVDPSKEAGVVITINTGGALGPRVPRLSANMAAKAGVARLMEEMAVDVQPEEARFVSVHPGVIATAMHARSGLGDFLPMTDAELAGNFVVFASSREAAFLNGRLAWATWDVEKLVARREEIVEKDLLRTSLSGVF